MGKTLERWPRTAAWVAVFVAAVWLWTAASQRIPLRPADRSPPASPLRFRDTAGQVLDLGALRGRVVLVNSWASWCAPCRVEIPRLARLHRELAGRGLVVLGLNAEGLLGGV